MKDWCSQWVVRVGLNCSRDSGRTEQPDSWVWYKLSWKRWKWGEVWQALSRLSLFLAGAVAAFCETMKRGCASDRMDKIMCKLQDSTCAGNSRSFISAVEWADTLHRHSIFTLYIHTLYHTLYMKLRVYMTPYIWISHSISHSTSHSVSHCTSRSISHSFTRLDISRWCRVDQPEIQFPFAIKKSLGMKMCILCTFWHCVWD